MRDLLIVVLVFIVFFCFLVIKRNIQFIRKYEQEEKKKRKLQKETGKKDEEDRKYDKVINCPFCRGTGEVILRREWRKSENSGEMIYGLATQKEYQHYSDDPEKDKQYNIVWDKDYRETSCLYCKGQGVAFAWYEKVDACTAQCFNCKGFGKELKKVKSEIGMEEVQVTCESCNGIGKVNIPEKEVVHIKTIARLKEKGGQFDGWGEDIPALLDDTITNENREFYLKSKPRII